MNAVDLGDLHALLCFATEYHSNIARALSQASAQGVPIPQSSLDHHRRQADVFQERANAAADRLLLVVRVAPPAGPGVPP